MKHKRSCLMVLALIALVVAVLACNVPQRATTETEAPEPTATPRASATSPPEETATSTEPPEPSDTPPPPTDTDTPPPPTSTPTPTATPTETPTSTPTPTETPAETPTYTPTPTETLAPSPTPTETAEAAGPLDFQTPSSLDSWRALDGEAYEATIYVHISGGAPPYTVYHDVASFTTDQTSPAIIFTAQGCNALVHTIKVESDDGQSVSHSYYIDPPWCDGE
jgi:outer membrane biosynthesis protein TonB